MLFPWRYFNSIFLKITFDYLKCSNLPSRCSHCFIAVPIAATAAHGLTLVVNVTDGVMASVAIVTVLAKSGFIGFDNSQSFLYWFNEIIVIMHIFYWRLVFY
ncbi:unnamed protein product [Protopolystoma xenopodis]|uniref:Uncharacterized protein n=1 Tax=Protopolystoma xenopodis TaxID=117903 RepID=A0A448WZZ9_9PLAT|nr:unnamed protein product [Protopolystoma xenopodis]